MTAKAYPYIRFSTDEQEDGDSIERQLRVTQELARDTGLPIATPLIDKGLSGYYGENRTKGKLGEFTHDAKQGKIAAGSILVAENFDRLGREGYMALLRYVVFPLEEAGVKVVTRAGLCGEAKLETQLLAQLETERAASESRRKSEMLRSARRRERGLAREDGRLLTVNCPNWLEVVGDTGTGKKCQMKRKFRIKPKAKKTLRFIFTWYLDGMSPRAMEKRLNERRDIWVPQRFETQKIVGWRQSYISKLLGYQALIGVYQPYSGRGKHRKPEGDPIHGYFPKVIEDDLWYAVQKKREQTPKSKGGKTGKNTNLFTHIILSLIHI